MPHLQPVVVLPVTEQGKIVVKICQLKLYLEGTHLPHKIPTAHALQDKLLAGLGDCLENSPNCQWQGDVNLPPREKCSFSPCSDCLPRTIGNKNPREPTPSILVRRVY